MSLTPEQAERLLYDWRFWARPEQLPPPGKWFGWLLRSGRGYGKTRTGTETVREKVETGQARRIALVGQTKADVRDTMIEVGDSAILNISPPWFRPEYEPSKRRLTWPNGAIGIVYSGDEPDQLRGPQHDFAWVDELFKFKYPQQTWDNLEFGMRIGEQPQVVITATPRPIPIVRALLADPAIVDVQRPTYDNIANLSPMYIQRVLKRYEGTRLGRQELRGEIMEDVPGALWKRDLIEQLRVPAVGVGIARVVVGVDPASTSKETSDETGIVAAALGTNGHGYILRDASLQGTPAEWAKAAVRAYSELQADRIVGEGNNGGEMVGYTILSVDPRVAYKMVWASRGKATRAEPISAMYEQERIHHVGSFPEMEDEMCTWVPGEKSPNRMDALVWALTELFFEGGEPQQGTVVYDERVEISPI